MVGEDGIGIGGVTEVGEGVDTEDGEITKRGARSRYIDQNILQLSAPGREDETMKQTQYETYEEWPNGIG